MHLIWFSYVLKWFFLTSLNGGNLIMSLFPSSILNLLYVCIQQFINLYKFYTKSWLTLLEENPLMCPKAGWESSLSLENNDPLLEWLSTGTTIQWSQFQLLYQSRNSVLWGLTVALELESSGRGFNCCTGVAVQWSWVQLFHWRGNPVFVFNCCSEITVWFNYCTEGAVQWFPVQLLHWRGSPVVSGSTIVVEGQPSGLGSTTAL